ncbi:MAG: hypothetical protein R3E11_04410 [Sphingobium sp.]|nr:hypothetical protein [Sphingobium sp.]MCP5398739.1 hypothetical protein [Sphingomonas sp.]
MRFVSPVALGLMLALGSASFGVAVPAAVAKEKASKAPKLKLSSGFLPLAQKASEAINKKDVETSKAALAAAEAGAVSNDDKYQYYSLLLNYSIMANDAAVQGKALKGMLDTGLVPADQAGQFNTIVANSAINAKDYDTAIAYGEKARALGYKPEQVSPILAQAIWGKAGNDKAQVLRGLEVFKEGIDAMKASGQAAPAQWYQVGVSKAAAVDSMPHLKQWAAMAYDAQPSGENLRTILRVFQRENPTMSNRENLDLLRLMHVSGGLALKPDFTEYAEMAFKGGLYGEVKAALDEGRSKGVLSTSDGADFYSVASQRMAGDKASLGSAERDAAKSSTGKIASATADAYFGYGDYAKAVSLFELALQKGGIDTDEVNTRLGIAKAMAGDTAGAKAALAKVTTGTRGGIAKMWTDYLNKKSAASAAAAPAEAATPAS